MAEPANELTALSQPEEPVAAVAPVFSAHGSEARFMPGMLGLGRYQQTLS